MGELERGPNGALEERTVPRFDEFMRRYMPYREPAARSAKARSSRR